MPKVLLDVPGVAMTGGPSLVFGTERRTGAVDAALINATAAAAGSETLRGAENAAYIVSLFGLCEERKKTGREFVDALMFGAEMSLSLPSTFSGCDPEATTRFRSALFGSIVAATRVLNLSRPRIAAALLMGGVVKVGGLPTGQVQLSGVMIGLGMKNALLAAVLAEAMDETLCTETIRSEGAAASSHAAGISPSSPPAGKTEPGYDLLAIQSPFGTDLWDQFERQAGGVLPRECVAPLFERIETIDKVNDLATVSRLLQGRGAQNAAAKIVFAPRGAHEPEETTWVP